MKHIILGIVGLAVLSVGVGSYLYFQRPDVDGRNIDLLRRNKVVSISSESSIEYFPGAKGYYAEPEAPGNYPGIVMIHENRGLRPEIMEAANELAKEGYRVLAVDLLGGVAEDQAGARLLTAQFKQEVGVKNMQAAVSYLRERGSSKIASLGWCFGGRQSVELAISGEKLDATVVYYGGGLATSTARLAPIKWPVLGIFGGKDQVIPLQTVEDFTESLEALGIDNEVHVYPEVGHAFANPSGANYAPAETVDAWEKTLLFLSKHLK